MKPLEYTYSVLRYRHDAAVGEQLNVAVVLYAPETGEVSLIYSPRYSRLSEAFGNFDGDLYRSILGRLETALTTLGAALSEGLFQMIEREKYRDVGDVVRAIWPDQGLSYFAGPVMFGVTADLEREGKELYDRFVLSRSDRRDSPARFDDEQLWDSFRKILTPRGITKILQPRCFGATEVEFQHTYKNERWHIIEPVSLDYLEGSEIKRKAYGVAGKAFAVRNVDELGSFTILLGKPRRIDSEKPYLAAKSLLRDLPVTVTLVEEDDVDRFADDLEGEMRRHGLLDGSE